MTNLFAFFRTTFFLTIILCISSHINAYDFKSGGIFYDIIDHNKKNVAVTSETRYIVNSYSGKVVIPKKVTYKGVTYNVTEIGDWAFGDCSELISVTIPNTITKIDDLAFGNCENLSNIFIPASVTYIGNRVFSGCSLQKINIDPSNPAYCEIDGVLFNKSKSSIISYPGGRRGAFSIPNTVTKIESGAFENCKYLSSIDIPNTITSIGEYAFDYCIGLSSVTIPNSVRTIGDCAFCSCENITSLILPNSIEKISASLLRHCSSLTDIVIPNSVKIIEDGAFGYCTSLTDITIPTSVSQIKEAAFIECCNLNHINIPNSILNIESSAFQYTKWYNNHYNGEFLYLNNICLGYKSNAFGHYKPIGNISIKEGTKIIANRAFESCWDITSINIPSSVSHINKRSFNWCSNLQSINVSKSNKNYCSINGILFNKDTTELIICPPKSIIEYSIPNSVTTIGDYAFYECNSLSDVIIPNSVTTIGNSAFSSCNSLTSIIIPNSVTSIGDDAFYGCSGLTSVTIPNSVTTIGNSAFSGCNSLTSAIIPDSVSIINNAFSYCTNLKEITIPNTASEIDTQAFYGCSSLSTIKIPKSITKIGELAFSNCENLVSIEVDSLNKSYCTIDGVLFNKDTTILIKYPEGKKGAYSIPKTATQIKDDAFFHCKNLTTLTIPNTIIDLGNQYFEESTVIINKKNASKVTKSKKKIKNKRKR